MAYNQGAEQIPDHYIVYVSRHWGLFDKTSGADMYHDDIVEGKRALRPRYDIRQYHLYVTFPFNSSPGLD